jgi:hypothetical protein
MGSSSPPHDADAGQILSLTAFLLALAWLYCHNTPVTTQKMSAAFCDCVNSICTKVWIGVNYLGCTFTNQSWASSAGAISYQAMMIFAILDGLAFTTYLSWTLSTLMTK